MKTKTRLLLGAAILTLSNVASAATPDSINGEPYPSLAPLVEVASPAVVNIRVSQTVQQRSSAGDR